MASPLSGVLSKLRAGQDATITVLGDSTVYGFNDTLTTPWRHGWVGALGLLIGAYADAGVSIKGWNDQSLIISGWPDGGDSGQFYDAPYSLSTGSGGGTLLMVDGGASGRELLYLDNATRLPIMLADPPDLIVTATGINDWGADSDTPSTFVSRYQTWLTNIQTLWPAVPILVTNENVTNNPTYEANLPGMFSALWTALASWPNVTLIDTRAMYTDLSTQVAPETSYSGVHPTDVGYTMQAQGMFSTLIPNTSTSSGTYGWTYDAPITPYSHLPWQVPFTLGGPAGKATGAYAFTAGAVGETTHSGSASGAYSWHAAAAGNNGTATPSTLPWQLPTQLSSSSLSGTAAGTYSWSGAAAGSATHAGSATGTYSFTGTATGVATHSGSGSGSYGFVGSAHGYSTPNGSTSGTYGFAANAQGHATHSGSATGTYSWHAAPVGSATHNGTTSGAFGWTATATGLAPTIGGHASGQFGWVANAHGSTTKHGAATGHYGWSGSAHGPTITTPHAEWTVIVPLESRTVLVAPESRSVVVS